MVIGKLAVTLGLHSANFDRGMPQAATRVMDFRREIESSTTKVSMLQSAIRSVTTVVVAAGAAAAAAAVAGFMRLRGEMDRIDQLGKAAGKLGIMTTMFVGLAHAANLSNVDLETLEKTVSKMERGLAEAAVRGGPVDDVLREVGIRAADIASMTPDAALYRLADALEAVESPMDRVRIATALFGRSGVDMLPMLQGGSAGLREMQTEAGRLGMTFSQADFAAVEQANDSITRLDAAIGALKRQLAIDFAPLVQVVAETLTTGMVEATAVVEDHTRSLATAGQTYGLVAESVFWLADTLDQAVRGLKLASLTINSVTIDALTAQKALAEMFGQKDKAAQLAAAIDNIKASMASTGISLGFDMAFDQTAGQRMRTRYQAILDEIARAKPKTTADLLDLEAIDETSRRLEEMQRRGTQLAESLRTPFEALEYRVREANALLQGGFLGEGVRGWETYRRAIQAVREDYLDLVERMSESTTPALIEAGSQAAYAAMAAWEARAAALAAKPMPGENLVLSEMPRPISERIAETRASVAAWLAEHPIPGPEVKPTLDPESLSRVQANIAKWMAEHPIPSRPSLTDSATNFVRVTPERIAGGAQRSLDDISRKLDTIAGETGRTTDASRRTAQAVERIQTPEVVEM